MKKLLECMKGLWWRYAIAATALLAAIVLDMFNPYFVGQLIDRVIENGEMSYLKTALIGIGAICLARGVFGYIKSYGFDLASSNVILRFRKSLFDHIQKLSFSFFDENNTGELMSRIKEDMDNVMNAICYGFSLFMEQLIYIIIASAILFSINWKLAIVSIITLPLIEYIVFILEKKIGVTYEKISDQRAVLNTTAQQNISGVRLVKALSREKHEINKFLKQNEANYEINFEQAKIMSRYNPPIEFLSNIVLVLIISFGGNMVIDGDLSLGTLVAFSNYIYMLIWPMRMMGWLTSTLAQCIASVKKIDKIFKEEPAIKDCEAPVHLDNVQGHVVFNNVSFEFGGNTVLDKINIDAKPGSKIAIMGITGSGKTSLINLIGRYYDCTSGEVLFDGVNVKDMELSQLRKNVSVVMQDTFLFSDTIEENIKFGCENVSEEEFMAAAEDSMVDEFVSQMPQGYKSVIGERGLGLSGGQKQRVSIARALVRNSRVLVLDDSTSALDMETEYNIQKALEKRKGMTCFIIAHRISAVKNADEILYFEDGRIVERGNHAELMKLGGRYYNTYCVQYGDYAETLRKEVI